MPLYEYKCRKCGHRFEKIESVNSSTTKKCPKCGATSERLLAAPAIQFKGTGWYVTDYAGKSAAKGGGEASEGSSADGAKKADDSKGSETKSSEAKNSSSGNEGSKKRKK
ncbi:MAG TPA: zinc ribbon domain-containing protein [Candidatus Acidoferrales bacterium]|nr:zinc ribbon domain-containing protein [Candidatus Acidoferrales bacterium]